MYKMELSDSEHSSLRNALIVAAEKYEANAQYFRDLKPQLEKDEAENPNALRMVHSSICDRMAGQFDLQAKEVRGILDKIDGLDG